MERTPPPGPEFFQGPMSMHCRICNRIFSLLEFDSSIRKAAFIDQQLTWKELKL